MSNKAIVLDANILIRAVLGANGYESSSLTMPAWLNFAPDVAYADARKYLPSLLEKEALRAGPRWRFYTLCNP